MNTPNLYWSAELASEAGGEPLNGLIEGNTYGLFCWDLRSWARLASLPDDAVALAPTGEQHHQPIIKAAGDLLAAFTRQTVLSASDRRVTALREALREARGGAS